MAHTYQHRIDQLLERLARQLESRGQWVTTAESCTGGGVACALTARPGSSAWFEFGFVTYSNRAKQQLLGVPETIFTEQGAVSQACVEAMAQGALAASGADYAVAISGIAGPDGGTVDKPVGTVWFGWAARDGTPVSRRLQFVGDRAAVREAAIDQGLRGLLALIEK